ncbi:hypothetical protein CC80DRAFT_503963 [Byssothecium circinans]|uniref:Uncharacterized protein n=1 Tax=Byssothecium circinans TaxID=147558 RepID=A0A6A5TYE8_9PLEO|nr:hypothetical protein CC80DRAFT_503963 [Byssothecium circinans]
MEENVSLGTAKSVWEGNRKNVSELQPRHVGLHTARVLFAKVGNNTARRHVYHELHTIGQIRLLEDTGTAMFGLATQQIATTQHSLIPHVDKQVKLLEEIDGLVNGLTGNVGDRIRGRVGLAINNHRSYKPMVEATNIEARERLIVSAEPEYIEDEPVSEPTEDLVHVPIPRSALQRMFDRLIVLRTRGTALTGEEGTFMHTVNKGWRRSVVVDNHLPRRWQRLLVHKKDVQYLVCLCSLLLIGPNDGEEWQRYAMVRGIGGGALDKRTLYLAHNLGIGGSKEEQLQWAIFAGGAW